MKYTNKHNLPKQFENFEEATKHDKGEADFSVTTLIDSAQIAHLTALHEEELEEDVSDNIVRLLGTAIHGILEGGAEEGDIVERRFFLTVADGRQGGSGYTVSGAIDNLALDFPLWEESDRRRYALQDWKATSGGTLQRSPNGKVDWERQTNLYDLLAEETDDRPVNIDTLETVVIIRDWQKSKAKYNPSFPQEAVKRIPVTRWSREDQYAYLRERIAAHTENPPAPCTKEERWEQPATYAVYTKTQSNQWKKRADRVLDSRLEADAYMIEKGLIGKIEERPGKATRCEDGWCPVAKWCTQYQDTINEEDILS